MVMTEFWEGICSLMWMILIIPYKRRVFGVFLSMLFPALGSASKSIGNAGDNAMYAMPTAFMGLFGEE
jgi:hypothetical protein